MRFVDNGRAEDFSQLCFKGMTVPISKCGLKYDIRKGDFVQPEEAVAAEVTVGEDYYSMSIDELELDTRAMNCLRRAKIESVGQLLELTKEEVLGLRSMGAGTVKIILAALEKFGLTLKESETEKS